MKIDDKAKFPSFQTNLYDYEEYLVETKNRRAFIFLERALNINPLAKKQKG
ncbi:MAG: hypothetical protein LBQ52_01245 [Helicobacteraceae bacterium]|jgi:hypothetical protein|nr:hypothetical protein [Helicobacteraceae bacterium]